MIFYGPEDYYFWEGIKGSRGCSITDLNKKLMPTFGINGKVAKRCLNAFKWGFITGLVISEEEYKDLTITKKSDKVITNEVKTLNNNLRGNC